jgi:probable rRNA maturation factor
MATDDSAILYRRAGRGFSKREVRLRFERLVAEVAEGMAITCLLTDDRELRRLNREFLNNDYATDVLSFPEPGGGELAISVAMATEQAAEFGHPVEDEIGILMLHGVLHLMGMDHEKDRGKMARIERKWREKLGLPVGLIERVKK